MHFFINWRAYPFSRLFFATRTSAPPVPAPLFCPVSVVLFLSCFSLRFPIGLCSLHWSQGFCTVSIFVHLAIVSLLPLFYLPFPCSVWHALSLASSFPIRLATSLCLSAVSPCPSFPRLYKRPISALLRLPPCPAIFCSPILVPSPLFCLFAKHCHTISCPRSPAVVFSPLVRPLLLFLSVAGFLPISNFVRLAAVTFLFCLFPRSVFIVSFWRALFLFTRFLYRLSKRFSFWFASLFLVPLLITLFQKQTAALQHLPLRLFVSILSLFSLMPYFFGTFILLCRVPIRLKESLCPCSFLRSSLAVFPALSALAFISLFSRASRPKYPSAPPFCAQKNRRIRRFFLYKLFLYALAFSISSPACSMPWPLSPSPPSSLATSFCRAVSSRRCTRVRVSSFSTVFSIR